MPAGVPDTDTFSMQDVVTEIGSGDDLQELFSLATGTFDPAYEGDKTNLLNFRNYVHTIPLSLFEPFDSDVGWSLTDANISGGEIALSPVTGQAINASHGLVFPIGTNVRVTATPSVSDVGDSSSIGFNGLSSTWTVENPFIFELVTTNEVGLSIISTKANNFRTIDSILIEEI